jgi:hypothetical protein
VNRRDLATAVPGNRILRWLADRLIARAGKRPPDYVIGGEADPYLRRWWLIPRNRFVNVYLHQFLRDDDDRALHDHPWLFNASGLLRGDYVEHTIAAGGIATRAHRSAGEWKFRFGASPHRVELFRAGFAIGNAPARAIGSPLECWTLFLTGPVVRKWGFHCPREGWIPWERFTARDDRGAIGKGCDA